MSDYIEATSRKPVIEDAHKSRDKFSMCRFIVIRASNFYQNETVGHDNLLYSLVGPKV